jgi:hypothetical protein
LRTVTIENTRKHDISLHSPSFSITIPAGGRVTLDGANLEALEDSSESAQEVIEHYFEKQWLKVIKS